jgi:hypothetical protein
MGQTNPTQVEALLPHDDIKARMDQENPVRKNINTK